MRGGFFIVIASMVSLATVVRQGYAQVYLEPIRVKTSSTAHAQRTAAVSASGIGVDSLSLAGKGSPARLLDTLAGVDVRSRGGFGLQQDLSVRGSTFEEAQVFVDGLTMNDPQTGHYSLDIPVTLFDLERMEVDARGAQVHYRVKRPGANAGALEAYAGQHGLWGQGGAYTFGGKTARARVAWEHSLAKAARPETDFEQGTGTATFTKQFSGSVVDAFAGYQKKDYGAANYYSNLYPHEEEHTRTYLVKGGVTTPRGESTITHSLLWRRHWDKFILQRNIPSKANIHTTDVYTARSEAAFPCGPVSATVAVGAGADHITSTNLGNRSRSRQSVSLRAYLPIQGKLRAEAGGALEHIQRWGWLHSFDAALKWDIVEDRLSVSPSFRRDYRVPTFTELYYSDVANRGNPSLGVEHIDVLGVKGEYTFGYFRYTVEPFLRKGRTLIDWMRVALTDPWQASNMGALSIPGVETGVEVRPRWHSRYASLEKASLSYIYMKPQQKAQGYYSKYALDIVKNKVTCGILNRVLGMDMSWQLSYTERYYGETYFLADAVVSRQFFTPSCTITPFFAVDDIANSYYSEVSGVVQPGRWVRGGVRISW